MAGRDVVVRLLVAQTLLVTADQLGEFATVLTGQGGELRTRLVALVGVALSPTLVLWRILRAETEHQVVKVVENASSNPHPPKQNRRLQHSNNVTGHCPTRMIFPNCSVRKVIGLALELPSASAPDSIDFESGGQAYANVESPGRHTDLLPTRR